MAAVYPPTDHDAINTSQRPRKLLDQARDALRATHYAFRSGRCYVGWMKRFIRFHDSRRLRPVSAPHPVKRQFLAAPSAAH
jgi:Phage integrase, N-terminal SAM-like domain